MIRRYAGCLGKSAIIEIEFDERFRMLRHKEIGATTSARRSRRPANLLVGQRADPFERPDAALIADVPVESRAVQEQRPLAAAVCAT